jgi:hypothetical protein
MSETGLVNSICYYRWHQRELLLEGRCPMCECAKDMVDVLVERKAKELEAL